MIDKKFIENVCTLVFCFDYSLGRAYSAGRVSLDDGSFLRLFKSKDPV